MCIRNTITRPVQFLRAPPFYKIIRDIERVNFFFWLFLRRATTRSYHFNHDKRRLDPYVIEWTDKRHSGNLTKRLRQAMMRESTPHI